MSDRVHWIEVGAKAGEPDPMGEAVRTQVQGLTGQDPGETRVHALYWLKGDVGRAELEMIATELLADPVVEEWVLDRELEADRFPEAVAFAPLPGVTDPAAGHVLMGIHDLGVHGIEAVISGSRVRFARRLPEAQRRRIAEKLLYNPTIQREIGPTTSPFVALKLNPPRVDEAPLTGLDDAGLVQLSRDRLLALSLPEMQAVQTYYRSLGREPRDAELETIAQTWSEHCVHKTLKGRYILPDRTYNNLLKETIFAATQQLARPWCVSVFADNAGVVSFVPGLDACFKVETHNHPSAIEPYGGAGTGVGGVIRDILGTGLGAMPIANTDVFCLADPNTNPASLPEGVLTPERIMRGVVRGVKDYGNCMGIPTVNGALYFHPRYATNPLVFCGTVGLIPSDKVHKEPQAGDLIALIGGGTGRDGIHGATFSSLTLDEGSEVTAQGAVQIGNPIMERRVLDALMKARDAGLMTAVTDCGAGGLSSAVGEMGEKLGARVHLERV
ncbi:MAG TPA: phosphoribosylformylglycinamidine synthase subunit PurS, partial [bacterium]|nr:phosphoribosylformylglycinamidine synthase subunit PurS [bacterium]